MRRSTKDMDPERGVAHYVSRLIGGGQFAIERSIEQWRGTIWIYIS